MMPILILAQALLRLLLLVLGLMMKIAAQILQRVLQLCGLRSKSLAQLLPLSAAVAVLAAAAVLARCFSAQSAVTEAT
jgi:hypothetical protein